MPEAAEQLLRTVPAWFGLPEANAEYVEAACTKETWTVRDVPGGSDGPRDGEGPGAGEGPVIGLTLVDRHFPHVAELHLMVVHRERHGYGVGTAMVEAIAEDGRRRGVRLLQVKTLGASHPDAGYALTRRFYESVGFLPLEETDLWGPDNPCLFMVRPL